MTVDASMVVALTVTNEPSGATGVMARRAAAIQGEGDAAGGGQVGVDPGVVGNRRCGNERRTLERSRLADCYTFCDTAAALLLRSVRSLRFVLDARTPIK